MFPKKPSQFQKLVNRKKEEWKTKLQNDPKFQTARKKLRAQNKKAS